MERPILFSGPLVRASLADKKTQTRRIVRPQPDTIHDGEPYWNIGGYRAHSFRNVTSSLRMGTQNPLLCPYGKIGDLLWVRETWAVYDNRMTRQEQEEIGIPKGPDGLMPGAEGYWKRRIIFAADGDPDPVNPLRWKPSIYLPRWAARLWLELTDVRVERLHEISGRDAAAEGFSLGLYDPAYPDGTFAMTEQSMIDAFARTWRRLNDKRPGCGWDSNPWVWVLSFRRIEKPLEIVA